MPQKLDLYFQYSDFFKMPNKYKIHANRYDNANRKILFFKSMPFYIILKGP